VAELASWVENNSVLVKRTFKGVSREFDVSLDALEGVLEPAYSGGDTTTSELVEDSVQSEAETFADARKLFAVDGEAKALWGTVHRYPRSAGGTLPQCDHYLTDADDRGEWIRTDKDDSELTAGGCD